MRLKLTVLAMVVYVISLLPIAFAQYDSCTDSDGIDYGAAGYVSLIKYKEVSKFSDYCFDGKNMVDKCAGDACYVIDYSCEKGKLDWNYNENKKNCADLGYAGCSNGACSATLKIKETCFDGVKNQDETDVDCGGVCGPTCKAKQSCLTSKDCVSFVCDNKVCLEPVQKPKPNCFDNVKNGDEEDVDCGGKYCKACLIPKPKEPKTDVTEPKKEVSENKKEVKPPAVTIAEDKKIMSCEEKCYQAYGQHKIFYNQCIKQKCEGSKKDDTALAITSPLNKKLEIQKKIIAEPTKKIEISKEELLVDGVKVDNKTVFIKTRDKEVRVTSTKKKVILKEHLGQGLSAEVDTPLIYEEGKIISGNSGKQVNIFPSDIKQKISGTYTMKLVDDGSPKYLVTKKSKRNLFGFIPLTLDTNYEISAESGEILIETNPFWFFLTVEISLEYAGDGDFCLTNVENIEDPNPEYVCDEGLRCERDVLATSDIIGPFGQCRLYPPAFHGKVVFIWDSWEDLEEFFERYSWDDRISMSEVSLWVRRTDNGLEVTFYKYLEWFYRANDARLETYFVPSEFDGDLVEIDASLLDEYGYLEIRSMEPSKYYIGSIPIIDGEERPMQVWVFSVNGRSETYELNLCGDNYNNYNLIQMLTLTAGVPPAPPLQMVDLDGELQEPRGPCD